MTDFELVQLEEQPDGSTKVKIRVTLDERELGRYQDTLPDTYGAELEILDVPLHAMATPIGAKVYCPDIPTKPTRLTIRAIARFGPVNAETVRKKFEEKLKKAGA